MPPIFSKKLLHGRRREQLVDAAGQRAQDEPEEHERGRPGEQHRGLQPPRETADRGQAADRGAGALARSPAPRSRCERSAYAATMSAAVASSGRSEHPPALAGVGAQLLVPADRATATTGTTDPVPRGRRRRAARRSPRARSGRDPVRRGRSSSAARSRRRRRRTRGRSSPSRGRTRASRRAAGPAAVLARAVRRARTTLAPATSRRAAVSGARRPRRPPLSSSRRPGSSSPRVWRIATKSMTTPTIAAPSAVSLIIETAPSDVGS